MEKRDTKGKKSIEDEEEEGEKDDFYIYAMDVFREERIKRELTQENLAKALGIDRINLLHMEKKRRKLKQYYFGKFCEVFNLTEREVRKRVAERREPLNITPTMLGPNPAFMSAEDYKTIRAYLLALHEYERQELLQDAKRLMQVFSDQFGPLSEKDQPWAYQVLGDVLLQCNLFEEAEQALAKAVEGYNLRRIDSSFQHARAYQCIASAEFKKHGETLSVKRARELAEKSWMESWGECRSWLAARDPKLYADYCKTFGEWAIRDGYMFAVDEVPERLDEAITYYKRAIARYNRDMEGVEYPKSEEYLRILRHRAHCQINIGWCHYLLEQPKNAIDHYREAMRLRLLVGEHNEFAYCLKNTARAYIKIATMTGSKEYWGRAEWCSKVAIMMYDILADKTQTDNRVDAQEILQSVLEKQPSGSLSLSLPSGQPISGEQIYEAFCLLCEE